MSISNFGISSACSAYATSNVYEPANLASVEKQEAFAEEKTSFVNNEINDEAIISDEARAKLEEEKQNNVSEKTDSAKTSNKFNEEMTSAEKALISKLKARDIEVKNHEQAHMSAAAGLSVSGPSYEYEVGPNGQKYAVGGEVSIGFVQSNNPEENIAKAEQMKNAALAPAQPSGQDRAVARNADKIIQMAKQALTEQQMAEQKAKQVETQNTNIENATNEENTENNSESLVTTV